MEKSRIASKIYSTLSCSNIQMICKRIDDSIKGMYLILRFINDSKDELIAEDIKNSLSISSARVSMVLALLMKKKYIKKEKSKIDKRKTIIMITESGKNALEIKERNIIECIENRLECLTLEESNKLLDLIVKMINGGKDNVKVS